MTTQQPEALRDARWYMVNRDCMTNVQKPAEIEHVADDVSKNGAESNMSAKQPAPAPQQDAQEPVAWYVTGGCRLLDEDEAKAEARHIGGTARAMPLYTAPQADSQPAQVEVADAMDDSQYLAGVSAGWNAANADNPNEALRKLHESRAGYLKPLSAARAQADSVTAPVGERENLDLRRMLCVAHAGAAAYMDDGEAQDSRDLPFIDFLRDTPAEIQDKLHRRALKKLAAPTPPAQAADSVLEDAARYRYLRDGDWREHEELESVIRLQLNTLWDAKIDAARAAQEGKPCPKE